MKRLILILSVMGLTLTGCQQAIIVASTPTSKPQPVPVQAVVSETGTDGLNNPMPTDIVLGASSGISPGTVEIGNYYPGATAEWKMLIHNGDGIKAKLLQITTEPNETVADIPLRVVLANSGLLDIDKIESTLPEHLEAVAYDAEKQSITIKGFTPNTTRTVKITYKTISQFKVYVKYPSKTKAGFSMPPLETDTWVEMDNSEILLRPLENGYVVCSLKVPKNVKIESQKWEFWVGVTEQPYGASAQISTQIELCSRIFVTMR